eukprot:jgi/Picsp_1/2182/NSC_05647-R1_caffeoyl- o-methyltransferase
MLTEGFDMHLERVLPLPRFVQFMGTNRRLYNKFVKQNRNVGRSSTRFASQDENASVDDPVNKRMLESALFEYITDHIREPNVLKDLRRDTKERYPRAAKMAVGPEQGAFLRWLVETTVVSRAIEVGVFTGYSSICIALGLQESTSRDGRILIALDRDEEALQMAQEYWCKAGVDHLIQSYCGPALESLDRLVMDEGLASFDFAFIDANKRSYMEYYEKMLQLIKVGGIIVIDNVLWYGRVADKNADDRTTLAIKELNDFIANDPRVSMTLLPIGDGLILCRKLDGGKQ